MRELRQARPSDLVPGLKIWYRRKKEDGGTYIKEVKELLDPKNPAVGYVATDGRRYGLSVNALVIARGKNNV